ncbi:MAG: methyltransferase domain-containing protein, partial [Burkholderiales bacterium]|nr:methyltransferase domain-containing protein [Burkholderiales bacterium]
AEVGNIMRLNFPDSYFDTVLAFGLYHNIEHGLEKAILETMRIVKPGGLICASFRADNIQTRVTDWLTERKIRRSGTNKSRVFHKLNLNANELRTLFEDAGLVVESLNAVENMPFLFKFRFFRDTTQKTFNENQARSEGYRLSVFGCWLQKSLMRYFPTRFCNIYVITARRI